MVAENKAGMRSVAGEPILLANAPVPLAQGAASAASHGEPMLAEPLPGGPPVSGEQLEVTTETDADAASGLQRESGSILRLTPADDDGEPEARAFTGVELEVSPAGDHRRI